ncbi:MAG: hypothetical protein ACI9U2_001769, partial [Bradymonadia bacterium]
MSQSVWILAAGEADKAHGRNFAPFFCRYGLAAIGPANHGPYGAAPDLYAGHVQRFVDMPEGALIALALGTAVTAVGEVTDAPYQFVPGLGHADSQDLRHVRRVAWRRIEAIALSEARKSRLGLVSGDDASRLRAAYEKGRPASSGTEYLPDLDGIGDQGVLSNLAGRGAPFDRLDAVAAGLVRARRLAAWQQATAVTTAEVRSLLVIPFLESLGWSPLSMRLDWRRKRRGRGDSGRFELALLERPDRTNSSPRAVVVVSRPGAGLNHMVRHAEATVGDGAGARLLIATDGRMWQVRIRDDHGWAPWATLDLVWPTGRFHFDGDAANISGATEAVEALSPWAALPARPKGDNRAPGLPPEVIARLEGNDGDSDGDGDGDGEGGKRKRKRRRRGRKRGEGPTNQPQPMSAEGEAPAAPQAEAPAAPAAPQAEAPAAPQAEAPAAPQAEAPAAPQAEAPAAPQAEAPAAPQAEAP